MFKAIIVMSALASAIVFAQPGRAFVFEGARLITGDGAVLERSTFVVANGRFASVGRQGEVKIPAGADRVDLTGKTVMPALIDVHTHLGYRKL